MMQQHWRNHQWRAATVRFASAQALGIPAYPGCLTRCAHCNCRRIQVIGGRHRGRTLDQHLVLVAWSEAAMAACKALNGQFDHKCVRDPEHKAATGSFGFHSEGFNALG